MATDDDDDEDDGDDEEEVGVMGMAMITTANPEPQQRRLSVTTGPCHGQPRATLHRSASIRVFLIFARNNFSKFSASNAGGPPSMIART